MKVTDNKKVILFDGVCNLCNSSVQFVLKRDTKNQFVFGSLQGKTGQEYLKKFSLPANTLNSFMLVEDDKLFTKSTGALHMLNHLGGAWSLLYVFILVPKFIRDAIYNVISKNRYKWFGKKAACWVPTPALKARFLD